MNKIIRGGLYIVAVMSIALTVNSTNTVNASEETTVNEMSGSGYTAEGDGMIKFDFAYGADFGLYGPVQNNLTVRDIKKMKRKIKRDEKKLAKGKGGNMSMRLLVRIEMNKQLIRKLEAMPDFDNGRGHYVYFDVAEFFEKANTDKEFNQQVVACAAKTMGNKELEEAAKNGDYASLGNVGSSVKGSVSSSVRNSVKSSVQSSVQQSVNQAVTQEAESAPTDNINGPGGNGGEGIV